MTDDMWEVGRGYLDLAECKVCGSLVHIAKMDIHEDFHKQLVEALEASRDR